jgi:hypothetical protein
LHGELPDYLLPTASGISPSGEFALGDYAGLYTLRKTGFDDYLESHHGSNWESMGAAAATADPDRDGFTTMQEYLQDTDPLVFDQPVAPVGLQFNVDSNRNKITFQLPMGKDGVRVNGQVSADMVDWRDDEEAVYSLLTNDFPESGWLQWVFWDLSPQGSNSPRFIRIQFQVEP